MKDLIIFGIQGRGKGTQASLLADKFGYQIFETGGALRAVMQQDSELGQKVKAIVERGDLVDNDIVMEIVADWLEQLPTGEAVLWDGIPRTLEQQITFSALLKKRGREVQAACLQVPRETVIERMLGRGRADDTMEVIERRLQNYEQETALAIDIYRQTGVLIDVDGTKPIKSVFAEICQIVE